MTPRGSFSALAISLTLLGLVAWVAAAHPADGKLFASTSPGPPASTAAGYSR